MDKSASNDKFIENIQSEFYNTCNDNCTMILDIIIYKFLEKIFDK